MCTPSGSLDGLLIKIGGMDDTVPVQLHEGDTVYICTATRETARRLAPHLFASTLRVHGTGRRGIRTCPNRQGDLVVGGVLHGPVVQDAAALW